MIKFIKIVSISILFLMLTSTICFATDINMNLQSEDSYSNSYNDSNNTHTTVSGQSLNNFSTEESDELTTSDIINILLIVVGVVLILLGIAILIRIHTN